MRLSIVIPVHNVAPWLPACLRSVLAAAKGLAAEVICVDDGSTDRSAPILRRYPVHVISQENRGYGAAINAGLASASGEFIAIVESDDRVGPGAWDECLDLLAEHPEADFARAPYVEEQGWRRRVIGLEAPPKGAFTVWDRPDLLDLPPAIWSCVYRRGVIEGLRLPETPGAAFQDTYFSMRFLLSGARAVWSDRPFYRYRANRPGASRVGRRRTDELLALHDLLLADLSPEALAHPDFAQVFHAAWFRRVLWFFERVAPGFREAAFREAWLQFRPVWSEPALAEAVAARLTSRQRRVFARFAEGRIDALWREFSLPPPRIAEGGAEDFELTATVLRELRSLLPDTAPGRLAAAAARPVAAVIAAGLRARLRLPRNP